MENPELPKGAPEGGGGPAGGRWRDPLPPGLYIYEYGRPFWMRLQDPDIVAIFRLRDC